MKTASDSVRTLAGTGGARQYSTFFVNGLYFGVEVLAVQEVILYQQMTRVPLAPAVISGIINLRGQIVTAIDLRRRLEMADRSAQQLPMNVVVRTEDGAVSLLVDEIDDVVEVQEEQFETKPDTLRRPLRDLVTGVYKLKHRLLLVLDVRQAVTLDVAVEAR